MDQNQGGLDRDQLRDPRDWRRSRSDRMLAGVCGGIARGLNVDPVLVRVVMAVLVISGPGILFYLAAWLLMPDENSATSPAQSMLGDRLQLDRPWLWPVVIAACVISGIAVMSSFDGGRFVFGPLAVLGLIWYFVIRPRRANTSTDGRPTGEDTGQTTTTEGPASSTTHPVSAAAGPATAATRPPDRTVEPVRPVWTEDDPLGLYVDDPAPTAPATPPAPQPPARGVRGVKPAVVALTGVALAIGWLLHLSVPVVLTIGLATLGLGMLVGGFFGRTLGLLPLGLLLAVGIAAGAVFPSVPREFRDVNYTATPQQPVTADSNRYEFDAGSVNLDLTRATFGKDARVSVTGKAGDVVVRLPADVDVTGTLGAEAGRVVGLRTEQEGRRPEVTLADLGADGRAGPASVVLDLRLKVGNIRVERG